MKKFLYAHYEKIILAVLLVLFAVLLARQILVVQKAQIQEVASQVNPVPKPSDYKPIDFKSDKKYQMETIFSDWNAIKPCEPSSTVTQMMTPYPLAECIYCHTLIPANSYPDIGETANRNCPACGKSLAPRIKTEEDELLGKDFNGNGIPDDWEAEFNIASDFSFPDSDEDSDGFTLLMEYKAKTDPTDSASHPKYISQIFVSAISQQRFTGLELVSVDRTKADKKDWEATFNVVRNGKKRTEFVKIDIGTFKNNNVDFSLVDIEMDEKTQEPVAYLQRVGKIERIPCRIKQHVYDPSPRVRFLNALRDTTFIVSVGSEFKLGTEKSGEEHYKVISAEPKTKQAVVESVGENPETFDILPAQKTASASTETASGKTSSSSSNSSKSQGSTPFLQKQ